MSSFLLAVLAALLFRPSTWTESLRVVSKAHAFSRPRNSSFLASPTLVRWLTRPPQGGWLSYILFVRVQSIRDRLAYRTQQKLESFWWKVSTLTQSIDDSKCFLFALFFKNLTHLILCSVSFTWRNRYEEITILRNGTASKGKVREIEVRAIHIISLLLCLSYRSFFLFFPRPFFFIITLR